MIKLVVHNKEGADVIHELSCEFVTVGRHPDNSLVLEESTVSNRHGELSFTNRSFLLRDLNSANGTTLNGVSVRDAALKHGDKIGFGGVEVTFLHDLENLVTGINSVSTPRITIQGGRNNKRASESRVLLVTIILLVLGVLIAMNARSSTHADATNENKLAAATVETPNVDSLTSPPLKQEAATQKPTPIVEQEAVVQKPMPIVEQQGAMQKSTPVITVFKPRMLRRKEIAYDFVAHVGQGKDGNFQFYLALVPSPITPEAIRNGFLPRGWNGKEWRFTIPSSEIKNAQHVLEQIHERSYNHTADDEMGKFSTTVGKVSFVRNSDFIYADGTKLFDEFDDLTDMFGQLLEDISP